MKHENHANEAGVGRRLLRSLSPRTKRQHKKKGVTMHPPSLSPALHQFLGAEEGVTAIEYGLLAALIAVAIIGALSALGTANGGIYAAWTSAVLAAL
jgi:pilus assembly protein Flp/PilA